MQQNVIPSLAKYLRIRGDRQEDLFNLEMTGGPEDRRTGGPEDRRKKIFAIIILFPQTKSIFKRDTTEGKPIHFLLRSQIF
jgi:hypothetical protein